MKTPFASEPVSCKTAVQKLHEHFAMASHITFHASEIWLSIQNSIGYTLIATQATATPLDATGRGMVRACFAQNIWSYKKIA
jgi:hypothetical protein